MMLLFYAALIASFGMAEGRCSSPSRQLWYKAPGSALESGLAIGNGRIGALVLGSATEKLILNENSVWSGTFQDRINPAALEAFPEIRDLVKNGNISEAGGKYLRDMIGIPDTSRMFGVTNDLVVDFGHSEDNWSNYTRTLDPFYGDANVKYTVDGVDYT